MANMKNIPANADAVPAQAVTASGAKTGRYLLMRRIGSNPWLAGTLLVVLAWVVYWPLVQAGYIWDDAGWIYQNPVLRHWHGLWLIWFKFADTIQYYPLTFTGFFAQYRLWGGNPLGYHIVNIFLQAAAGILLWRVLRRLDCRWAWLAALLFTIHPVQVETVGWAAEQKNLLSGILYFAAALFYLRFLGFGEPSPPPLPRYRSGFYLLATLLFLLALLAKTAVCTLPAVLLIVIWWKRGRVLWRDVLSTIPWFISSLVMGLVTIAAERHQSGAHGPAFHFTWAQRTIIAGRDVWFYLLKLVWPHPLLEIYPRWHIASLRGWAWLYPLAVLVMVASLWLLRRRIGRGPLAAAAFFLVTMAPTLGFISFYTMMYTFVADHYQYLACIGPMVLAAEGAALGHQKMRAWLRHRRSPTAPTAKLRWMVFPALTVCGVGILALLAHRQCWVYVPPQRVWSHVLKYDAINWAAMENLASCEFAEHYYQRAWNLYRRAEKLPGGNNYLVHQDMGDFELRVQHNVALAAAQYRRSLALNAHNLPVILHLIACYEQLGQWPRAVMDLGRGLQLYPHAADLHFQLAGLLARAHRYKSAALQYTAVVALEPRNTMAQYDLAITLDKLGRPHAALRHYRRALRVSPQFALAHYMCGKDWLKTGHPVAAAAEFRAALALGRKSRNLLTLHGETPPAAVWLNQAMIHEALATALEAMGNRSAAQKQRNRAAQIRARFHLPPHSPVRSGLPVNARPIFRP